MPLTPYIAADGKLRQRSLSAGDGSPLDPDVTDFSPKYLNDSPINGITLPSEAKGVIGWLSFIFYKINNGLGASSDPPAQTDTSDSSLISLIKRTLVSISAVYTKIVEIFSTLSSVASELGNVSSKLSSVNSNLEFIKYQLDSIYNKIPSSPPPSPEP